MAKRSSNGLATWLSLAFVIFLVDQLTKLLVVRSFSFAERKNIFPGWFDLTLLYNKGAAFSFLASGSGWQRWFFIGIGLIAAVFIIWMLKRHPGQKLFCFALAMILGGAMGNVLDRMTRGQVVDFLLVYYDRWFWPAFNVADSAITLGAAMLILDEILRVKRSK
jgi:signal peptidase II